MGGGKWGGGPYNQMFQPVPRSHSRTCVPNQDRCILEKEVNDYHTAKAAFSYYTVVNTGVGINYDMIPEVLKNNNAEQKNKTKRERGEG